MISFMANFIQRIFGLQKRISPAAVLNNPALVDLLGGRNTESGVRVDEASALSCATVWAAVRVISEGAASLPLITYRRDGATRARASEHPLYSLLHDEPCPGIGSLVFRESLFAHALTYGNGYAEIERRVVSCSWALCEIFETMSLALAIWSEMRFSASPVWPTSCTPCWWTPCDCSCAPTCRWART